VLALACLLSGLLYNRFSKPSAPFAEGMETSLKGAWCGRKGDQPPSQSTADVVERITKRQYRKRPEGGCATRGAFSLCVCLLHYVDRHRCWANNKVESGANCSVPFHAAGLGT
jgi:hypothetical protein